MKASRLDRAEIISDDAAYYTALFLVCTSLIS